jgi:hypothetical protein
MTKKKQTYQSEMFLPDELRLQPLGEREPAKQSLKKPPRRPVRREVVLKLIDWFKQD